MFHFRKASKAAALTALVLALLLAASLLCGCEANVKPVEPTEEENRVVGTVGKWDIRYDELRYVTLNCKEELKAKYGEDIFESASASQYREELETAVKKKLASSYYALCAMADEYYLGGSAAMLAEPKITEKVTQSVNELAEECGGVKQYREELKANFLTDRLVRFYTACEECAIELTFVMKTDFGLLPNSEEAAEEILYSDRFIRTNHVFISGRGEESRQLAEKVREQLLASENPELEIILLKGKYDSDFTMTTTHGKYFGRYNTDYGDDYEKAAFALKVGEISEIVEGTDGSSAYIPGYFVILRMEPEKDWIQKNFTEFAENIVGSEFNIRLEEFRQKLVFTPNNLFLDTDLTAIQ